MKTIEIKITITQTEENKSSSVLEVDGDENAFIICKHIDGIHNDMLKGLSFHINSLETKSKRKINERMKTLKISEVTGIAEWIKTLPKVKNHG